MKETKLQDTINIIREDLLSEWIEIIPHSTFGNVSEEEKRQSFRESFVVLAEVCIETYFNSLVEHGKVIPNWGASINLSSLSWIWGTTDDDTKLMLAATNLVVSGSALFNSNVHYVVDGKRFEIYKLHGALHAEEV
jgi:hypothetical protein